MTPARRYPVVLEYTQHRIAWVEAESQDDAVAQVRDQECEYWEDGEEVDYSGLSLADKWTASSVTRCAERNPEGPKERCPACGAVADHTEGYSITLARHDKTCPWHRHYLSVVRRRTASTLDDPWRLECSCGINGPDRTTHDEAAEDALVHCAMVAAHGMNVLVGITEDKRVTAAEIRAAAGAL